MIVFVGSTGAGKTLQAEFLAKNLGCAFLSTGEFFRKSSKKDHLEAVMHGRLVSDEHVIEIVERMTRGLQPFAEAVIDGFPRSTGQAQWLVDQASSNKLRLTAVIHLVVSQDVVAARLLSRARPDDHLAAIKRRYAEYEQNIPAILAVFEAKKVAILTVNADDTIEKIHAQIANFIEPLERNPKK